MLKYTDTLVGFREVPNHISLCINISNCQLTCEHCHSPELRKDIGIELTYEELCRLIEVNKGIDCVCFMGHGKDVDHLNHLAAIVKEYYSNIKTAVYLGLANIPEELCLFYWDFVKIGSYMEKCGPLDKQTTNQRMYKITFNSKTLDFNKEDVTQLFWHET